MPATAKVWSGKLPRMTQLNILLRLLCCETRLVGIGPEPTPTLSFSDVDIGHSKLT